jgi:hypothetical protein
MSIDDWCIKGSLVRRKGVPFTPKSEIVAMGTVGPIDGYGNTVERRTSTVRNFASNMFGKGVFDEEDDM